MGGDYNNSHRKQEDDDDDNGEGKSKSKSKTKANDDNSEEPKLGINFTKNCHLHWLLAYFLPASVRCLSSGNSKR